MRHSTANRLLLSCLVAALAACDQPSVEVDFAEPFPAGAADVTRLRFPARQQGRYVSLHDSAEALRVATDVVLREQTQHYTVSGHWLDSLRLSRRAGQYTAGGQHYRVQPLAADSFRLSWVEVDTALAIRPGRNERLRYYKGWYYLNQAASGQPNSWRVSRLKLTDKQLTWQAPNPDSLRLRALDASALRERRAAGRLYVTVQPPGRRSQRQVHEYAGLWLTLNEYERRP